MSKILHVGRLTKAQRRITIFVSVTGQKLYTVGVGTVLYLPQWFALSTQHVNTHQHTHTHTLPSLEGYKQVSGVIKC